MTNIDYRLKAPLPSQERPNECTVSCLGQVAEGSVLTVLACNNGNDQFPAWEDITGAVESGQTYLFVNNSKTAPQWGFDLWVTLDQGSATEDSFIQAVEGYFRDLYFNSYEIIARFTHQDLSQYTHNALRYEVLNND